MSLIRSLFRDPQCDDYVTADCGHEVYDGETMHRHGRKWYCPFCHDEDFDGLPADDDDGIFEPTEKVVGVW